MHGSEAPSDWVVRWAPEVKRGPVLDVACGHGRHMRWLAAAGFNVTGVDRSPEAIASVETLGRAVQADIENGAWPFEGELFDAVVVTNYLWRPLMNTLLDSVAPGGVLIYETFAAGNEFVGKPSRPDFLLQPGELLRICEHMRVVAFGPTEEVFTYELLQKTYGGRLEDVRPFQVHRGPYRKKTVQHHQEGKILIEQQDL